ncbi:uncharacterized protein Gr63a [Centruroides vittatus]|uniref:uncharacterized protein Gr63a n=1 Tax=Centruroides vittatus TaxID=120091 RepID=UPI003510288F
MLWISIAAYVTLTAHAISQKFQEVSYHLKTILGNHRKVKNIKIIQTRHSHVINMITAADLFLSPFIFLMYLCTVPATWFVLRYSFFVELSNFEKCVLLDWIISFLTICVITTLAYGQVAVNAHEPEKLLHEIMNLSLKAKYKLQIYLFLERLHGPTIGLSCLGIFVVTYGTLSNLCSMIATYLLMYSTFNIVLINTSLRIKTFCEYRKIK